MATIVKYILDIETGKSKSDIKKTEKAVDGLNKDLKKTEIQGKKSAGALAKMGKALGTVGVGVAAVGVLALGLKRAAEASYDFAKASVDSVNQLNDIAVKSGISAQGVQAIIQAFEGSGQAAGAADAFMSRLPQTFAAIATAGTRSSKVAKGLGIALTDASGEALSSDQIMVNLTDKFQSIEDPTKRATAAFLLFGRSAGSFLQAFGASAEFEKFLGFAEKFGVKTGPEASAEAASFQEELSALSIVSQGTFQTIATGTGVISVFSGVLLSTGKALAFVQSFVTEGRTTFEKWGAVVSSISDQIGGLGSILLNVLSPGLQATFQAFRLVDDLTDGAFSAIAKHAKNSTIEMIGLESAFIAGDLAASNYEASLKNLLSGIDVSGSEAAKTEEQLAKLLKELQGIEDVGAGEVKPEDTSKIDNAIKLLDDYIAKSKIITESDQLEANFAAVEEQIRNAAEESGDFVKGMEALGIATDGYESALAMLNQELEDLEKNKAAEKQAEAFAKLGDQITRAGDGLSSLLTGDVSGLIGGLMPKIEGGITKALSGIASFRSLGGAQGGSGGGDGAAALSSLVSPIASAVSGVFGSISQIGAAGLTDPNVSDQKARSLAVETIEERVQNQARAFAIGLQVLPEILINTLPGLLSDFSSILIDALMSLPELIGQATLEAFKSFGENRRERIDDRQERRQERRDMTGEERRESRRERRSRIGGNISGSLETMFNAFRMESGGRIPFAESGLRFTGESTGMAVLHPGEFVVPRTGQAPQNVQRDLGSQSGGGGMTINITGDLIESNAVDELVRRIENRFLSFGGGSSPLFGGA